MGLFGDMMGIKSRGRFTTVKVSGSLSPIIGKNVEQKKMEKIAEMEQQGYTLVSSTGKQLSGEGFLGGFMGGNGIEYTLVFEKP